MNRVSLLAFLLMFLIFFMGCAPATNTSKNFGKIKENNDVTSRYKSYFINPDYNYFYYGPELQPDTIMGIEKKYDVQSTFWNQPDLTEEQLKSWVVWGERQNSGEDFSRRYSGYQGAYVLDPDGKVIGDWYSKKDMGIFDFPGNRVIIPYPPRNQGGSSNKPCS